MKRKQVVCPTSASHYCNHLHAKLARALHCGQQWCTVADIDVQNQLC
jgi:hypothetical protein